MNDELRNKLKDLPKEPGVYFHKDSAGEIIYVGKAAILKNRVRHYFQASKNRDPKTESLVGEIVDTDWMVVESELEALFLEAEMIRRYMPKYNILLRDDKSLSYVRIDFKSSAPSVTMTRRPVDDNATYYGPYFSGIGLKRALKYLRKIFPYSTHTTLPSRGCLLYHLSLCPGPETAHYNREAYVATLKKLSMYLKGERVQLVGQLEREMRLLAKEQRFEEASKVRNQLFALKSLNKQIIFSDKEFMDISKDHALNDLSELLGLSTPPRRIEGYDISHMSGTDTVASMVVFTNGVSDKAAYRKFKMRLPGNDDFIHMNEVIKRRTADDHMKKWGKPDLFLIDGGKGQLGAALEALQGRSIDIPAIGLAKQYEQIVIRKDTSRGIDSASSPHNRSSFVKLNEIKLQQLHGVIIEDTDDYMLVQLPQNSHIVKLLQRIRDESHRFAVNYHSTLKQNRLTVSALDEIPTIGPKTKKLLLKTFGSYRGIVQARDFELDKIVGTKKATIIRQYTRKDRKT